MSDWLLPLFAPSGPDLMIPGRVVVSPKGWIETWDGLPEKLRVEISRSNMAPWTKVRLTKGLWHTFKDVHAWVRREVTYQHTPNAEPRAWRDRPERGDCTDMAWTVFRELFPAIGRDAHGPIGIALVTTRQGRLHVAAISQTTRGLIVIDPTARAVRPANWFSWTWHAVWFGGRWRHVDRWPFVY